MPLIAINEVKRPNQLPEGLTNKSAIPAAQCDAYHINSCDIESVHDFVFEQITTATAANKTGSVIFLKNKAINTIYVKELSAAVVAAANA